MDVYLYIYDLSKGLAKQISSQLLGTQIDAVYHTSIVFNNTEYFFGAGVQTCAAGTSHHGAPIQKLLLGTTQLPLDVIVEYLDTLKISYTADSYDLFNHNCNNFSNDFATFLTGNGIPDHIVSLPQTVMSTPFGQLLRPQIENAMRPITQAKLPNQPSNSQASTMSTTNVAKYGTRFVTEASTITNLDEILSKTNQTCAIIFFMNPTCGPCKTVYDEFSNLAESKHEKCKFIIVNVSIAKDASDAFGVKVVPTFITYLHGTKHRQWNGPDVSELRTNVQALIECTSPILENFPHSLPKLREVASSNPILYTKACPRDKLREKLAMLANNECVTKIIDTFSDAEGNLSQYARASVNKSVMEGYFDALNCAWDKLDRENLFAVVDLIRTTILSTCVSESIAKHNEYIEFIRRILNYSIERLTPDHVNENVPYALHIVTLQLACNTFRDDTLRNRVLQMRPRGLVSELLALALISLKSRQASYDSVRIAAANLLFNIALSNSKSQRMKESTELLKDNVQVQLLSVIYQGLNDVISENCNQVNTNKPSSQARDSLEAALGLVLYLIHRKAHSLAWKVLCATGTQGTDMKDGIVKLLSTESQTGSSWHSELRHEVLNLIKSINKTNFKAEEKQD